MQKKIKILIDRIFGFLVLILLMPLIIIISAIIRIDGPIFFFQQRLGKNGKIFTCVKFRTMILNADKFLDKNGMPTKDRVTKFGKFLRKTSLDEIPQIFNIVLGQMSFVGPRPTLVSHWTRYTSMQKRRFEMSPGITGLAQINGRNNIPWTKRIEFDLYYIDNFSLWLDIKILIKTIKVVFQRKNIEMDRNSPEMDDLDNRQDKN